METSSRIQTPRGPSNYFFARGKSRNQEESIGNDESQKRRTTRPITSSISSSTFLSKSSNAESLSSNNSDVKLNGLQRKGSIARSDARTLHGPRPLQEVGKRIFSEGTKYPVIAQRTPTLPSSTSMPAFSLQDLERRPNNAEFDDNIYSNVRQPDPLPTVNFDDFQSEIARYDNTSKLSTSVVKDVYRPSLEDAQWQGQNDRQRFQKYTTETGTPLRLSLKENQGDVVDKSTDMWLRKDINTRAVNNQLGNASITTDVNSRKFTAVIGQGRQATSSYTNPSPRKPVGPTLMTGILAERRMSRDISTTGITTNGPLTISQQPNNDGQQRRRTILTAGLGTVDNSKEQSKTPIAIRSTRVKSLQPTPRSQGPQQGLKLQTRNDPQPGDYSKPFQSPANGNDINTPLSATAQQRLSGRMSGLGARTVSPTDARRLQRASVMSHQIQSPKSLSVQVLADPMPDWKSGHRSPSMIPRKASGTPSSTRGTPDSNAQYFLSATSLSRSSSHQSLRSAGTVNLSRMAQSPSMSRLPTPKGRNVHSSAEVQLDEFVPPVPAIPKAYESPHESYDSPNFAYSQYSRPSQPNSAISHESSASLAGGVDLTSPQTYPSSAFSLDSQNMPPFVRSKTYSGNTAIEPRSAMPFTPAPKKKALQSVRLPPLSLQPISSPTAAKIAALPQPSLELDQRRTSPASERNMTKTPNTPMTASKATFRNKGMDFPIRPIFGTRSSSSYQLSHTEPELPLPTPVGMPGAFPLTDSTENSDQSRQVTPFTPASPVSPDAATMGETKQQDASALSKTRPRTLKKLGKESSMQGLSNNASIEDPITPRTVTPGRRKFSMSWIRGTSKAATPTQIEHPDFSLPSHSTMPQLSMPQIDMPDVVDVKMRKTSAGSLATMIELSRRRMPLNKVENPPPELPQGVELEELQDSSLDVNSSTRAASWSVNSQLRPLSRPLTLQEAGANTGYQQKMMTDKDDQAADEEMFILASKRKDIEAAARATEDLQKQATMKPRMTPAQAIQSSVGLLNIYEKGEIIDYKDGVYFCGTRTAKKHVGNIATAGTTNFGYDDERGDYNICIGDHLAYRYEVIDVLGKGSFGQVLRCIDHKEGTLVAVKIIRNKKRFHQQALVEVDILRKLRDWDPAGTHATLTFTSSFYFRQHLCIVTPCLSNNLYELIREHNFQGFSLTIIRRFARQMLTCLKLLQSKSIIHCDLKPENILLCNARKADIRVIDFGSSCKTDEKVYTYIQSRFYRSPEVILGSEYGLGIDMWSFGCILAELYTGYPIFPGENEQEQLACIMEIFGPPSREIIEKCSRRKLFFDSSWKPRITVSSKGKRRRPSSKTLQMALKCDDEAFLDFITQCLRWDPERRIRADHAAEHCFITNEPFRRQTDRVARARMMNLQNKTLAAKSIGNASPSRRVMASPANSSVSQTFTKDLKPRPLPQTPSTVLRPNVRNLDSSTSSTQIHVSPVKSTLPTNRRLSSIVTSASSGSISNSRRVSNTQPGQPSTPQSSSSLSHNSISSSALPRMIAGRMVSGGDSSTITKDQQTTAIGQSATDLASAAARECMGFGTGASSMRSK